MKTGLGAILLQRWGREVTTEHEAVFQGRSRSGPEHLANVQATIIGVHKLVERARTGDPAEADANVRCAAYWLRLAADELTELVKSRKD
ncbi:hypothetical protein G3A43_27380 [Paraburkholderia aspalathi]|uniref:hypothetical protein n=1 Tax=Paraburkholderia nemoris TaxID=2793076 RepID=UPI00190DD123|nr:MULTISPECIES: hypothetical protein [Paraburkholderia]MBK3783940.1 hypothetical protein [Paraburkholderia aspalathi]